MYLIKIEGRELRISETERILGVVNDNKTEVKIFIVNRYYEGLDLSEFSPNLQVKPIDDKLLPYSDLLTMVVKENQINLLWTVRDFDVRESGRLWVNVYFGKNTEETPPPTEENPNPEPVITETKVWQSIPNYFLVKPTVDMMNSEALIPPSIFEQAVIKATEQAQKAQDAADEAQKIADSLKGGSNLQYESSANFPNVGEVGFTYIDTSTGNQYYWDNNDIGYKTIMPDISLINGGSA